MHWIKDINVRTLIGLELAEVAVNAGQDEMTVREVGGRTFRFYHEQECCESVGIYDVQGPLRHLLYSEILDVAETIDRENYPPDVKSPHRVESFTWTTYRITTARGTVTIRWFGESNGYYGESVTFIETTNQS